MQDQLIVDFDTRTVRPMFAEGDAYFGLELGTNGTAAEVRRAAAPSWATWQRHDGKRATGLDLAPASGAEWINPWSGLAR